MALDFNKFAQEGNTFINKLSENLGHTSQEDRGQVTRILKAVMHTLRDSLEFHENLHVISQLPMALKAVWVDQWEYKEKPHRPRSIEEFEDIVKSYQRLYGEQNFDWGKGTDQIVRITIESLKEYITLGEAIHVMGQLPKEVQELMG
ncbi:hypothetical protein D770_16465 [Flammeovirgaceae bacterium 311]|nr:hypothetical protein D770_16465 [Flammeovirgaceae bacterium 311]